MPTAHRRPSAAMVVALAGTLLALAALVLSLTGIATGLPGKNRIDRNDLRKRVVKAINIQRNAVRPWQLAPGAVHRWHLASDVMMWAFVDSNGALLRSSGGVTSTRPAAGTYDVTFPRSVDNCAYTATNAAPDGAPPATGQIAVALRTTQAGEDTVRVRTENSAGGGADDQFMLHVLC